MNDKRQKTEDAFRRADGGLEPSMERLMAAAPDLVGEAQRRRAAASRELPDFFGTLVPLAWKAVPRLGAAAALLLAASTVLFFTTDDSATTTQPVQVSADSGFEQLILTGSVSVDLDDPLLDAITADEDG
jgi:hypothetical protein